MGVWDRDYTKARYDPVGGRHGWSSHLPPRGALALIVLHLLGFFVVYAVRHDARPAAAAMFALSGAASHPAAIALHPLGAISLLTLAFVIFAIWTLGGRVESRFGTGRLLLLYVLGIVISGAFYFGFAQIAPDLARYPLALPAGALAAWALGAWRNMSDEVVSIFGKLITFAKATAIAAAIVVGLIFFRGGADATGLLLATAAGSLAWPLLALVRSAGSPAGATRGDYRSPPAPPGSPSAEAQPTAEDREIDELLAKISRAGFDALSPAERQRLEAARRAKLRRSR